MKKGKALASKIPPEPVLRPGDRRVVLLFSILGFFLVLCSFPSSRTRWSEQEGYSAVSDQSIKLSVDINTAPYSELMLLPGIGPKLAQSIIEFREKNGPFKCNEDVIQVRGIGEKKLQKILPHLQVIRSKE